MTATSLMNDRLPETVRVLLVDDQAIIGESVRRMLADERDLVLEFCSDPTEALRRANVFGPTVILQDLVMPEVDGLTLVRFFRANPATRDVPLIVLSTKEEPATKAEAFSRGANDYLVKLPDPIELIARIRYHSRGYIALQQRNEAYLRLAESRRELANQIDEAAKYVHSLLPPTAATGPIRTDWRFVPSMHLGGDSFGYHALDDDHFAIYLLDVSGHGVGASLLSVSAMNVLASQSLPMVDFREPAAVLEGLNIAFDMERHDGKYFTMWYGVFQSSTRMLRYAGAGHPPAALFSGTSLKDASLSLLESGGPVVGFGFGLSFDTTDVVLPQFARLYIFSDGAFEIQLPNGGTWTLQQCLEFLHEQHRIHVSPMDALLQHCYDIHGSDTLDDDFSILQCEFL